MQLGADWCLLVLVGRWSQEDGLPQPVKRPSNGSQNKHELNGTNEKSRQLPNIRCALLHTRCPLLELWCREVAIKSGVICHLSLEDLQVAHPAHAD